MARLTASYRAEIGQLLEPAYHASNNNNLFTCRRRHISFVVFVVLELLPASNKYVAHADH